MSQPPLSVAMRQLESTIGAQLFERTVTGVILTPAGLVLKSEASRLLAHSIRAYELTKATALGEMGDVRIAFITSAMVDLLPKMLAQFTNKHTDVRLKLVEAVSIDVASMVADGKVDVGLLSPPVKLPKDIERVEIANDRLIAIVPRGHKLAGRASIDLEELQEEHFVSFSEERVPSFHHRIVGACTEVGFHPKIVQEASHVYTIIALVAGRLGVALVPSTAARSIRKGVVPIPLRNESRLLHTSMEIVYYNSQLPAAGRTFITELIASTQL